MMQVFDASSILYAWDNYPIDQFPSLWEWLALQIEEKKLVMLDVAYKIEVVNKTPECAAWLISHNFILLETNDDITQEALRIKQLIGVTNDNYHPRGVDEIDLFIIAATKIFEAELISNEARQVLPPNNSSKRKIPAVCIMLNVPCNNFIEYIKRSGVIFG